MDPQPIEVIHNVRKACIINAKVHDTLQSVLRPGISTEALAKLASKLIVDAGGTPSFPRDAGFPAPICVSINEEVGHGVPSDRILRDGDLVKIDIGVEVQGCHSDCAKTHIVGSAAPDAKHLCRVTRQAMMEAIATLKPGERLSNASSIIEQISKQGRLRPIRTAFGHGLGQRLHQDPQIASFGPAGYGPRVREGWILAIEPILTSGSGCLATKSDGWTTVTTDGAPSAHFEHTVLITARGPEILTDLDGSENARLQQLVSEETPRREPRKNSRVNEQPTLFIGPCRLKTKTGAMFSIQAKRSQNDADVLRLAQEEMNEVLLEAWGRPVHPDEVLRADASWSSVVIDHSGHVAGFVTLSRPRRSLHVNTLVISKSYQRTGLGSQVMHAVEQLAKEKHLPAVELWVQTNNLQAIHFYERLGFERIGVPYINTLAMRKRVLSS